MALEYNGMTMSDGTEFRVLMEIPQLVQAINSALKAAELLVLPMGMHRPGNPKVINLQQVVSLTDYSR